MANHHHSSLKYIFFLLQTTPLARTQLSPTGMRVKYSLMLAPAQINDKKTRMHKTSSGSSRSQPAHVLRIFQFPFQGDRTWDFKCLTCLNRSFVTYGSWAIYGDFFFFRFLTFANHSDLDISLFVYTKYSCFYSCKLLVSSLLLIVFLLLLFFPSFFFSLVNRLVSTHTRSPTLPWLLPPVSFIGSRQKRIRPSRPQA